VCYTILTGNISMNMWLHAAFTKLDEYSPLSSKFELNHKRYFECIRLCVKRIHIHDKTINAMILYQTGNEVS